MEELEFTVKTIATMKSLTLEQLATQTGISYYHLKEVSAGRVKLTLEDAKLLSDFSGVPVSQIVG